jgi:hypothetical protein
MTPAEAEYTVLRQTIAARGTARMALVPITFIGWASLAFCVLNFTQVPLAALYSLAVLVSGFEAVHALHVGVERVGRYLQVYYETPGSQPQWETTVMSVGPGLPGGGVDPLFSFLFASAAFLNIIPALALGPDRTELGVIGTLHLLFVVRVVRSRGAAARQRAVDLETFRAIRNQNQGLPRTDAR